LNPKITSGKKFNIYLYLVLSNIGDLMTEDKLRKLARERAKAKLGFYVHLIVYIVVNAFLILLWYLTPDTAEIPWFVYPLVGWGIGLVAHGVYTFYGGTGLEDSMTERELEKLKAQ
jgi:hypothetical protein